MEMIDWNLVITNYGEGGLQNGRGAREILPLQKGGGWGGGNILAMLKGGGAQQVLGQCLRGSLRF